MQLSGRGRQRLYIFEYIASRAGIPVFGVQLLSFYVTVNHWSILHFWLMVLGLLLCFLALVHYQQFRVRAAVRCECGRSQKHLLTHQLLSIGWVLRNGEWSCPFCAPWIERAPGFERDRFSEDRLGSTR